MKASFFWKVIQESILIIEMMIQNNIKSLERMEVLITFHVKVFLDSIDSKYNSYIYIYIVYIYYNTIIAIIIQR